MNAIPAKIRSASVANFGSSLVYLSTPTRCAALDIKGNGRIDIADFGQFSVRFFTTLP